MMKSALGVDMCVRWGHVNTTVSFIGLQGITRDATAEDGFFMRSETLISSQLNVLLEWQR